MMQPHHIDLLDRVIVALRVLVVVSWSVIGAWGIAAVRRLFARAHDRDDYVWISMLILTCSLFIFQFRALAGLWKAPNDGWTAVALTGFAMAGMGLWSFRARGAAEDHQRATLICYLIVFGLLILAGLLA